MTRIQSCGSGLLVVIGVVGGCRESACLGLHVQRAGLDQRLPTFRRGARRAATGGRALSAIGKHPPGYFAPTSTQTRVEAERVMSKERFAGVDWASEVHAVCVVDERGRIVEGRQFGHDEPGILR